MYESIYLLQTRESIAKNEDVYKIGRTSQDELKRFNCYPRGSVLHLHISCIDSTTVERNLIKKFNDVFENHTLYGSEYFEGNPIDMIKEILCEIGHAFECESVVHTLHTKLQHQTAQNATMQSQIDKLVDDRNNANKQIDHLTKQLNELLDECREWKQDADSGNVSDEDDNVGDGDALIVTSPPLQNAEDVDKQDNGKQNVNGSKFVCQKCNKAFSSNQRLKGHMEKCDGLDPKQCKICFKMFSSKYGKYQHMKYVKCSPPPKPQPTN